MTAPKNIGELLAAWTHMQTLDAWALTDLREAYAGDLAELEQLRDVNYGVNAENKRLRDERDAASAEAAEWKEADTHHYACWAKAALAKANELRGDGKALTDLRDRIEALANEWEDFGLPHIAYAPDLRSLLAPKAETGAELMDELERYLDAGVSTHLRDTIAKLRKLLEEGAK